MYDEQLHIIICCGWNKDFPGSPALIVYIGQKTTGAPPSPPPRATVQGPQLIISILTSWIS